MKNTVEERRARGLYWNAAWKLIEGCSKISPGCDNCWSEEETAMRCGHPNGKIRERARSAVHLAQIPGDKTMFDGRIVLREDNLELPLRTKKPTVFAIWNDLFHEDVPDEFIIGAFIMMNLCPQHTFLVLTKRAERMGEFYRKIRPDDVYDQWSGYSGTPPELRDWPLPNVWHGVTVENQQTANERIPQLLRVPGKRFLSIEPMLGPVDLVNLDASHIGLPGYFSSLYQTSITDKIHAVLLGGESGKNARPMHRDWARVVRDQCVEAGVPFFFKQWGEYAPNWFYDNDSREIPNSLWMDRMGKRLAGRIFDGHTHDELPW